MSIWDKCFWCRKTRCQQDHEKEIRDYRRNLHLLALLQLKRDGIILPDMDEHIRTHELHTCICGKPIKNWENLPCNDCMVTLNKRVMRIRHLRPRGTWDDKDPIENSWYYAVLSANVLKQNKNPMDEIIAIEKQRKREGEIGIVSAGRINKKLTEFLKRKRPIHDAKVRKGRRPKFWPV